MGNKVSTKSAGPQVQKSSKSSCIKPVGLWTSYMEHYHRYEKELIKIFGQDPALVNEMNVNHYIESMSTSDSDFRKATREQLLTMLREYNFERPGVETFHPATDLILDPHMLITMYKLARVIVNGELDFNCAVLITLYVRSTNSMIAYGETGQIVLPQQLKSGNKYVVQECIVAGFQFFGSLLALENVLNKFASRSARVVSNFDASFPYNLGDVISVSRDVFAKPGIGCVTGGIHCFLDAPSALQYRKTGFCNQHLSDVISAKLTKIGDDDDNNISLDDELFQDEKKILKLFDFNLFPKVKRPTEYDPNINHKMIQLFGKWHMKEGRWTEGQIHALDLKMGTNVEQNWGPGSQGEKEAKQEFEDLRDQLKISQTPYEILQVSPDASLEVIKAAYNTLILHEFDKPNTKIFDVRQAYETILAERTVSKTN